jgi:hypothetical protein
MELVFHASWKMKFYTVFNDGQIGVIIFKLQKIRNNLTGTSSAG